MAHVRFVVQGRCPCSELSQTVDRETLSCVNVVKQSSSLVTAPGTNLLITPQLGKPSGWRTSLSCGDTLPVCQAAGSPWLLARRDSLGVFPPSVHAQGASWVPSSARECDISDSAWNCADNETTRPLGVGIHEPKGRVRTPATSSLDSHEGDIHVQHALLHLLGPSTGICHSTGSFLIGRAAMKLAALLAAQKSSKPNLASPAAAILNCFHLETSQSCTFELTENRADTPPLGAKLERLRPMAQPLAVSLASVATALVLLPRIGAGEHPVQGTPGWLFSPCNANSRTGRLLLQMPTQQAQLQDHRFHTLYEPLKALAALSPEGSEAANAAAVSPPLAVSCGGPRVGQTPAVPWPSLPALPVGTAAVGAVPAERPSVVAAMAARTDFCRGPSSGSSGENKAEAASCVKPWEECSTTSLGASSRAVQLQAARPVEGDGAVAERQHDAERPKVFDNPLRYFKLLFAGAMSAVVSRTCVAPLERVKMDLLLKHGTGDAFTTAVQVLRTEGIAGFWKGNALNVLRTAPFKAVNFLSFDVYHMAFLALSGRDENLQRFLAGACAGVTATLVCFPLDVVRTRLMASVAGPRYGTGPFATLAGILRDEGASALYSGCLPAVIGMAPAGAVFYGVYDLLKHRHLESLAASNLGRESGGPVAGEEYPASTATTQQALTLDPLYTLLYGAMSGAGSELIVYPLEVIRRKMQLQSMALANMRQLGGMHSHHPHLAHLPRIGPAGTASSAGAAAAGRLAAAAHHHHMLPYQLGAQKMMATLSAAAVANSPGLARVAAAVTAILTADGPRGFYSGLLPNMLQVLPSAALSYYTYDSLKTALGTR